MRRRPQQRERESIAELFGDVIQDKAGGLYGEGELRTAPSDVPRSGPVKRSESRRPAEAETAAAAAAAPDRPEAAPGAAGPRRPAEAQAEIQDRIRRGRTSRREAGAPPPRDGQLRFADDRGLLGQVAIWHGLATILTLGFYRFWMKTEQRRVVWSHTVLDDEPFEYTGTGLELFIGGMIAVIFLAATLAAANLGLTFVGLSYFGEHAQLGLALVSLIALPPLIQYAIYRARRYRLSRTRWRGIRFGMDGSGLTVALLWAIWMPFVIASAGLLWPFWRVARERYLTNHAMWGDERFRFRGSALRLMPYWGTLWLIGAALVATVVLPFVSDSLPPAYGPLIDAAGAGAFEWLSGLGFTNILVLGLGLGLVTVLITVAYFAAETRLYMNARRIAGVVPRCTYGSGDLWHAYSRVMLRSLWPGILVAILIGIVAAIPMFAAGQVELESFGEGGGVATEPGDLFNGMQSWRAQGLILLSLVINYVLSAMWGMWLWLAVWFRTRHANLCAATSFAGLESLDTVRQRAESRQADAEGFADAMDLGGL